MKPQLTEKLSSPQCFDAAGCEACGGDVACGAMLSDCWCSEVKLNDEVHRKLRDRYQHCLCRHCLLRFAEEARRKLHVVKLD